MTSPPLPGSPRFVERLLAERIGLDAASVGDELIQRGVQARMKSLGVARLADYERILLEPTDEIQALIEEVVIPESWFFRDDRPFAAFRELARCGWVDQPGRPPLSVLCLPCAGGEEPYSVVMSLLDLGLPPHRFAVTAIDISERSLVRAARGVYGSYAFRGVVDEVRDRYFDFTETRGRYLLRAAVRAAVRFERGNILDFALLRDRPGFDVVFCRNLLIYFDEAARARAFANLDRLTNPESFLFLGHADRPDPNLTIRFVPHEAPGSFLYRKGPAAAPPAPVPPPIDAARLFRSPTPGRLSPSRAPGSTPAPGPAPVAPGRSARPGPARAARTVADAAPPASEAGAKPGDTLTEAMTLADRGQYAEATRLVEGHLGRGQQDARSHFLLGMIHQAAGKRAEAEAELLKAVYLDPEHDEALLDLALLARRRGDMAAEALFRRRAERVRARQGRA